MAKSKLRIALAVLILAPLIVFLAANAIVTSGILMRIINSSTDEVQVRYASASGTILTDFRFKDLQVDGEDSNVKWQVKLEEVALIVPIHKLRHKIFETKKIHGKGFRFHLDFKPKKKDTGPPNPYSYLNKWRIRLAGIDLHEIHHIRVGDYVFPDGPNTSLQASFYFWPEYEVRIDPSRFKVDNEQRQIDLAFELKHLRFRDRPGFTFFRDFSAELKAHTAYKDNRFLNYYFQAIPWLRTDGGQSQLDAWIRIEHGVVDPKSHAHLDVQDLQLKAGGAYFKGSGWLELKDLDFTMHLRKYRIDPFPFRGERLDLSIAADKIDLVDPLAHAKQVEAKLQGVAGEALECRMKGDVTFKTRVSQISTSRDTMKIADLNIAISDFVLSNLTSPEDLEIQDWWGRIAISDTVIRSGKNPKFAGKVWMAAVNGKPLFAILQNMKKLPINLSGIIPMWGLQANADFNYDHDGLRVFDIQVESSTLNANGNLRVQDGQKFGKLHVNLSPFSFDVDFGED